MDVTDVIGPFGKLQTRMFMVVLFRSISWSFLKMNYYFSVQPRKHICTDGDILDYYTEFKDNITNIFKNANATNQCYFNESDGSSELKHCTHWIYDNSDNKESLVEEWDLVCDSAWTVSFGYMVYSVGNFIAYMPAGQIADKFGRKPIILVAQTLVLLTSIIVPLCNNTSLFLFIRALTGFFQALAHNALLCSFLEAVGPKYRDYLMYSFSGMWGLGVVILSGLAWLVSSWRTLAWISSIPVQLPLLLGIWWFVPESTKWLVASKHYERAEKQLMAHAKVNGTKIEDIGKVMTELKSKIEEDKNADKATFVQVLTNNHLRKTALLLYATFIFTVFVGNGFAITIGTLGGSIYFNMFLGGLSNAGVVLLYHIIVRNLKRRQGLCLTYIVSGIAFLLVVPIPPELHWLKLIFAMTGNLTNSLAYVIIYIFSAELFPTNVRTVAVSGAMTAGRIGAILAPFADVLTIYYGNTLPVILYGCLSLMTAGIFFLLPETRNIHLPDTVLQSEKINMARVIKSPAL